MNQVTRFSSNLSPSWHSLTPPNSHFWKLHMSPQLHHANPWAQNPTKAQDNHIDLCSTSMHAYKHENGVFSLILVTAPLTHVLMVDPSLLLPHAATCPCLLEVVVLTLFGVNNFALTLGQPIPIVALFCVCPLSWPAWFLVWMGCVVWSFLSYLPLS